uniref:Uncharacterized protein n=1 Tax=Kalanchoe fedtschenkoi TaxID=63787 RepID=A0A7N0ZRZ6_KALFE
MADSGNRAPPPHILIITFPAIGHIFPQLRLAHQFLTAGVTLTFMLTPKNLKFLQPLQRLHPPGKFQTLVLPFPDIPGMPPGAENLIEVPGLHFAPLFIQAYAELCGPVGEWIESHPDPPVAIMSDVFFSEATQRLAVRLGIKFVGFSPVNAHSLYCCWGEGGESGICRANMRSWALVFNTFEGLDDLNVEFYKERIDGGRVYAVGPLLSLESHTSGPIKHEVIEWLNDSSHSDNSVVYVGFGTQVNFSPWQVKAIADALDASGCKFIWAVKVPLGQNDHTDLTAIGFPEGLAERMAEEKRGIVTTEWVPQRAILNHPAVGAYLTHSGWNSVVEGLIGGVVMLLWPMQADHHDNAKRLADELNVAVRVCAGLEAVPDSAQLAKALADATSADGGYAEVRKGAVELGKKALSAIDEENAGSSIRSVEEFVKQVKALRSPEFDDTTTASIMSKREGLEFESGLESY